LVEGAVAQASHDAATGPERPPFDPSIIRAVAFDGYGTLFDWDFRAALAEFLALSGLEADHEVLAKTFASEAFSAVSVWAPGHRGEDGKLDRQRMLDGPTPEFMATWEMWRRQFEYTFEKHGLVGDATAGANHLRGVLARAPAYTDAFETVERIAAHGLLVGLMSNADEDFLQGAVSHNRLRFSVIQSSESLRIYKPHRAAFVGLCSRLGCEPNEVLYVGDSSPTDVLGALHAGLWAAWIHRSDPQPPQDAVPPKSEGEAGTPVAPTEAPHEEPPKPDLEVTSLLAVAEALGA
jgi:2-haloalkanoic acid dehalogenase type II